MAIINLKDELDAWDKDPTAREEFRRTHAHPARLNDTEHLGLGLGMRLGRPKLDDAASREKKRYSLAINTAQSLDDVYSAINNIDDAHSPAILTTKDGESLGSKEKIIKDIAIGRAMVQEQARLQFDHNRFISSRIIDAILKNLNDYTGLKSYRVRSGITSNYGLREKVTQLLLVECEALFTKWSTEKTIQTPPDATKAAQEELDRQQKKLKSFMDETVRPAATDKGIPMNEFGELRRKIVIQLTEINKRINLPGVKVNQLKFPTVSSLVFHIFIKGRFFQNNYYPRFSIELNKNTGQLENYVEEAIDSSLTKFRRIQE